MLDNKSVLITGAFGFLGQVVVQDILQQGAHVYALDLPNIVESKELLFKNENHIDIIGVDILDENLREFLPASVNYVIHLAALTSVRESFKDPVTYLRVNTEGTINLLKALEKLNLERFIFASTAAVYGENTAPNIDESFPLIPSNPYGASKAASEYYVKILSRKFGFDSVILRFFNIYGPGMPHGDSGIINSFLKSLDNNEDLVILGEGNHIRTFTHIKDASRALVLACNKMEAANEIMNISGTEIAIIKLAKLILKMSNRDDLHISHKLQTYPLTPHSSCSGELADAILGHKPTISMDESLSELF